MSKKVCNNCKSDVKDSDKFCPKCGSEVVAVSEFKKEKLSKNKDLKESLNEEKKSGKKKVIIAFIVVLLLAIVGVILWFLVFKDDDSKEKGKDNEDEIVEKEEADDKEENDDEEDNDTDDGKNDNDDEGDDNDDELVENVKYYGNTYIYSDGFAWLKDSSYIYLVNEKGKVVNKFDGKKYDGYYNFQNSDFRDGYAMIGNELYDESGSKVVFDEEYSQIEYYDDGLLVVTTKEENYKGTTIKKGIYDLDTKKYVFDLNETVYKISYLGEKMYLLYFNEDNRYVVYDAKNNNSFYLGDRFDVLKTEYRDGYIIYQNTNANEIYSIDREGNKKLIVGDSRHAQIGQYSDGLLFVNDAFYDINGNKVIDLKDEGVSNKPQFVNGYALVFFDTGYFTVLSKESKEYMFEPVAYTSMGNTYNGKFSLGLYNDQTVISKDGHLIVRLYDEVLGTKKWAIMDVNGEIVHEFSESVSINTLISDNGYIGVSDSSIKESYFVSTKGKKLAIKLENN